MIVFTVIGNAVPVQSFRFRSGKRSYQPARVLVWKEAVAWAAREAYRGAPLTGKLRVTAEFHLSHKRRCDVDNLWKGTADSLCKIVFADDSQIVDLRILKIQPAAQAQVVIRIEELTSADTHSTSQRRKKVT